MEQERNDRSEGAERSAEARSSGPMDVVREGRLKMNLWRNEGEKGPYLSTDFAKTYTDREGNPRDTRSIGTDDLLPLANMIQTKGYERAKEAERELWNERQAMRDEERARYTQQRGKEANAPRDQGPERGR